MKFGRTASIVIFLLLSLAVMTGCGGQAAQPTSKTTPNTPSAVPQVFTGSKTVNFFQSDLQGQPAVISARVNFTQNADNTFTGTYDSQPSTRTGLCFNTLHLKISGTVTASGFNFTFTDQANDTGTAQGTLNPTSGTFQLTFVPPCSGYPDANGITGTVTIQ